MESKEIRTAETAQVDMPADELALRGGLHGRMAEAFCTLQSSVDALQRYLDSNLSLQARPKVQGLLDEMNDRIACLERLSYNAARLATGAISRGTEDLAPLELTDYLGELTSCTNETLAMRGFSARIVFENNSGQPHTWIQAGSDLLDGILMNLLSNLLWQRRDGIMRLTLLPDRILQYTDNGPGMAPELARALLEQGRPPREILGRGALGLLLVRDYSIAMGWHLTVKEGTGLCIQFVFPQFEAPANLVLWDGAAARNSFLHTHLDRELNGVFGILTEP